MRTMKLYINLAALFLIAVSFMSCERELDSANVSRITYFPTFNESGSSLMLIPGGTPFTDPGVTATEKGASIPVNTSVVGTIQSYSGSTVNTDLENEYVLTYSATNSDGFSGSVYRTVWVAITGDLVTSIEGLYTSTVVRNGVSSAQYTDLPYVLIYKTGPNTYAISDAAGGYYDVGRGYGAAYRGSHEITAVDIPSNDFTYGDSFGLGVFGGTTTMSGMTVDPVAKTITFTTVWIAPPTYTFVVTLTQVTI